MEKYLYNFERKGYLIRTQGQKPQRKMLLELTRYKFKNFVFKITQNHQLILKRTWENVCHICPRKSVDILNI